MCYVFYHQNHAKQSMDGALGLQSHIFHFQEIKKHVLCVVVKLHKPQVIGSILGFR